MELRVVRHTDQFDRACHFWGELLGWPVTREWPASEHQGRGRIYGYGDAARVELIEIDDAPQVHGVFLAVQVDDAIEVRNRLAAAGLDLLRDIAEQPWGHRNLAVIEPSGIEVVLFQVL